MMTTQKSNGHGGAPAPALLLLGAAVMLAGACGRTGISMPGSGNHASVTTGGSGGLQSLASTSSQGGTTDSTSSYQGGALSSAVSTSAGSGGGGVTVPAGSSAWGGASSSGGSKSSGGSSGGGTTSGPRVPTMHRPQATTCVGVFAPAEPVDPSSSSACKKHADCTQGNNGRCITDPVGTGRGSRFYYCSYDKCATDADCDPGRACFCSPKNPAQCFYSGNCRIDADCAGGAIGYCSPGYGSDCAGYHWYSGYYCHTPEDTCLEDSDCTGKDFCDYNLVNGRWECTPPNMMCAIG